MALSEKRSGENYVGEGRRGGGGAEQFIPGHNGVVFHAEKRSSSENRQRVREALCKRQQTD